MHRNNSIRKRAKNMENRIFIDGLEFNETQDRVRDQLEGIVGVHCVALSEGQNYVDVSYDEQTSIGEIDSHLKNNGYKVSEIY
jgi:hypothetical protein